MVDGNTHHTQGGKESGTRPLVNMLLVLGFDVYGQSAETTAKVVKAEGYDLRSFTKKPGRGSRFMW